MFGLEKIATKLIITGVISLSILGGGWYMWNTIQRLEAEKKSLLVENDTLRYINTINIKNIEIMEKNEKVKDELLRKYRNENASDKSSLDNLRSQLKRLEEKDNGPVAKVLKDTVSGIEALRETRKLKK